MLTNIFIFIVALFMVIKGATMATKYAAPLAKRIGLSEYTVGFIIIAIISILPETFISISSSLKGIPSFGLAMLLGSNVADLTLIFAAIIFFTGKDLKVESKILKNHIIYPLLLILPLVLGLNGHFSRLEGVVLILAGGLFYYMSFKNGEKRTMPLNTEKDTHKNLFMLLFSMAVLLAGSHFTVSSASALAYAFGVTPVLVGMLVVGLGTTMPEFFFALKSIKGTDDSLAIGDILGTVLADATIVVGILALVNPFSFPQSIVYVTGIFMVLASFILFHFMRTGRDISKREGYILFIFWICFVFIEFFLNK